MADHAHDSHGGGHDTHKPAAGGGHSKSKGSWGSTPFLAALVVGVVVVLWLVNLIPFEGAGVYTPPAIRGNTVAAQSASDCSGVSRSFDLGTSNELINGGAVCTMVGWDIDRPVVLVDDKGQDHVFKTAEGFEFKAAHWRAVNGQAHVTAVFCPPNSVWNGINACS